MYAIIEDSGTQIKVSKGDVVDIDLRTDGPSGDKKKGNSDAKSLTFDRVLMVGGTGSNTIGTPYISGATVSADVVEEIKGEKLDVLMYKRRKGQRRKIGHRQSYLRIKITDIKG